MNFEATNKQQNNIETPVKKYFGSSKDALALYTLKQQIMFFEASWCFISGNVWMAIAI